MFSRVRVPSAAFTVKSLESKVQIKGEARNLLNFGLQVGV
jgi:hypothetical protein